MRWKRQRIQFMPDELSSANSAVDSMYEVYSRVKNTVWIGYTEVEITYNSIFENLGEPRAWVNLGYTSIAILNEHFTIPIQGSSQPPQTK